MDLYALSTEAIAQPLFKSSATQLHALGTIARDGAGRIFRYCLSGVTQTVGNTLQAAAQVADHQNLTPTVTTYGAVGDTVIVATLAGTAVAAANLYADGFVQIDTTPGLGYSYRVIQHAAVLGGGVITLTLDPSGPIQVALTASSRVSLVQNPYKYVIQSPTTASGAIVGVSIFPITNGEYGWIQTGGVAGVLTAGSIAVGQAVAYSATAGACAIEGSTLAQIGRIMVTGAAGRVQAVMLTLDS